MEALNVKKLKSKPMHNNGGDVVEYRLDSVMLDHLIIDYQSLQNRLESAESERDELKSKLAQLEREIPKTPEGFPKLDNEHLVKICIHQQSKLAEMGSASNEAFPFIPWSKEAEFFASQPIANNSERVQASEPFMWVWVHKNGIIGNHYETLDEAVYDMDEISEGKAIPLYREQVTPNKAEVPNIRDDLHHLLDGLENLMRNSNDAYDKRYIRGMISKVSIMIVTQPLPPLKGDDK